MPYDNSNSGMLSRNDRKRNDNDPNFTGQAEVGGIAYWISAWTKEAGPQSKMPGRRFFSLSFRPKDAAPVHRDPAKAPPEDDMAPTPVAKAAAPAQPPPAKAKTVDDEDVPF